MICRNLNQTYLYLNEFFTVSRSIPDVVKLRGSRMAAQIKYGTDLDLFEYWLKSPGS